MKAAPQFVNWVYSASTTLSFCFEKERHAIPTPKGIESQRKMTLPEILIQESHVIEGHGDWFCGKFQLLLVVCSSDCEINPLLPHIPSLLWRLSTPNNKATTSGGSRNWAAWVQNNFNINFKLIFFLFGVKFFEEKREKLDFQQLYLGKFSFLITSLQKKIW